MTEHNPLTAINMVLGGDDPSRATQLQLEAMRNATTILSRLSGVDKVWWGAYTHAWLSLPYAPALLELGGVAQDWERKLLEAEVTELPGEFKDFVMWIVAISQAPFIEALQNGEL